MRILFNSYAYPNPLQPGLCPFNRTMIAGLAALHDVRVVSPVSFLKAWAATLRRRRSPWNDTTFQAVDGVIAEYVPFYYPPRVAHATHADWLWWSTQQRLHATVRDFRPDVVLSYWTHPDGEVAVRLAEQHKLPSVVMVGGSDVLVLGRSGPRREKILSVLHQASAVVTVSDQLRETLVEDGIDPGKVSVIPRGVDQTVFHPSDKHSARAKLGLPPEQSLLVAVGRLVPIKGLSDLLEACRILVCEKLDFRCVIIGEGPLRGALEQQRRALKLEQHVQFIGSKSQDALADWYRAADLTVLSSHSEGIPNVLLESITCGTPFVATRVGGIPEIADRDHDRLVPPRNPSMLAEAILGRVATGTHATRRYKLPPTQADSAEQLGFLLQSVVQGIAPQVKSERHTGTPAPKRKRLSDPSLMKLDLR